MARGQRKFDKIVVKDLGVEVDVFIVTDGEHRGQFRAEYADDTFTEPTFDELRRKVVAHVQESNTLAWFPIIEVKVEDVNIENRHNGSKRGLSVEFKRYYVARKLDGSFLRVEWDIAIEHRIINAKELRAHDHTEGNDKPRSIDFTKLPDTCRGWRWNMREGDRPTHYLAYDERLFLGFQYVGDQLLKLEERLQELIGSDRGRELIVAKAPLQLTKGEKTA